MFDKISGCIVVQMEFQSLEDVTVNSILDNIHSEDLCDVAAGLETIVRTWQSRRVKSTFSHMQNRLGEQGAISRLVHLMASDAIGVIKCQVGTSPNCCPLLSCT